MKWPFIPALAILLSSLAGNVPGAVATTDFVPANPPEMKPLASHIAFNIYIGSIGGRLWE